MAGVKAQTETEEENDDDDEDYDYEQEDDEELESEEPITQSEIDEITGVSNDQNEEQEQENNENPIELQPNEEPREVSDTESTQLSELSETRRSTRETRPVERLTYSHMNAKMIKSIDGKTKNKSKRKVVRFSEDTNIHNKEKEYSHNIIMQKYENRSEYTKRKALIAARIMNEMNNMSIQKGKSFAETYSLKKGIRKFGKRGYNALEKEIGQLDHRVCFQPTNIKDLSPSEKKKAMDSLAFFTEKRDKTVKARTCANGSTQREYMTKEEAASPTASLESIMLTATIDAHEKRKVAIIDVPNAFVQTKIPQKDGEERIIMKIQGIMVDILVKLDPELYGPHVVFENGINTLYVIVLRAIYDMLQSALQFRKDLEGIGLFSIHMIHV